MSKKLLSLCNRSVALALYVKAAVDARRISLCFLSGAAILVLACSGCTVGTIEPAGPSSTSPLNVTITAPASGATVSDNVTVIASVTGNASVEQVEFDVDGAVLATVVGLPYQTDWNTVATEDGSHTLTVKALDSLGGTATSAGVTVTVSNTPPGTVATPTFSPPGGTYSSAQSVIVSDATPGATIYCVTSRSPPAVCPSPVMVSSSETLSAQATKDGMTNSAVASATYTIQIPTAATPTFLPAAGTYSSAQSVTLSCTTPSSTIYYTTNGTAPTHSSTVYSSTISVSATETIKALCVASGYADSAVASATYTITGGGGGVARPSYNTGVGFFTQNGKLYDANGVEFHIKGVNSAHYDQTWASCTSNCGLPNAHVNANRIGTPLWSSVSDSTLQGFMNKMVSQKIVPIPGVWFTDSSYSDSGNVTCKNSTGSGLTLFNLAVSQWVARYSVFKPFERYMLLNIANEWGSSNSTAWRDAYQSAVATLRAKGYLCTLVIDAGGCGQDPDDIVNYAQAIYDSDPQHNIVFSQHVYGGWGEPVTCGDPNKAPYWWSVNIYNEFPVMRALGLPIIIGEFGPATNAGPSPTGLPASLVIQAADAQNFGWMAWAWDDGSPFNLTATVGQGQFLLTNGVPDNGDYPNNTDLSAYGNDVVLNPTYGTFVNAQPATIFP